MSYIGYHRASIPVSVVFIWSIALVYVSYIMAYVVKKNSFTLEPQLQNMVMSRFEIKSWPGVLPAVTIKLRSLTGGPRAHRAYVEK